MSNNMADEYNEDNLDTEENLETEAPETSTESSTGITGKPEPRVPLSRLREEVSKRKEAEAKVNTGEPLTEEKFQELLSKVEAKRAEAEKAAVKAEKAKLDELHKVHGEFDNTKLKEIISRYGVFDDEGNPDLDKGLELYERLGGVPAPKKKMPSSQRTEDNPRKEEFNPRTKTMWEIIEEAKKQAPDK